MKPTRLLLFVASLSLTPFTSGAAEPKVLDDLYELTQFASEPDIVTPVGMTFDSKGRMLVVEVHTHFPPKDYSGPKHDRIRLIEDTDGDGKADRFRSFYEGSTQTMSLRAGSDGWIYVATRMKIFRIRDTNGDDKADEEQQIAWLDTQGNYPHNGLCGLSFDKEGQLLFGLGENLGKDYVLNSAGGTKLPGGGEGGNIYRCTPDGKKLERVATGFWNPFGICVDPENRIFCVGNDPDSMPPCRLMHIVKGGDYGYQFRYGRSGRHPLQAWDGELPGTLPMVAGTGEAPCSVIPYRGQLWVTSWGDYRIERYTLTPRGASFGANFDVAVQGDENFRPVDIAVAPDGSLFFTDWVDRSYPVHGKGRIWKLSLKPGAPQAPPFPDLSEAEGEALLWADCPQPPKDLLGDEDPFLRNAAIQGLSSAETPEKAIAHYEKLDLKLASQRVALLEAGRRAGFAGNVRQARLEAALTDEAPEVKLYALRWIADEKLTGFLPAVRKLAKEKDTTPALFTAAVATADWLDGGKVANLKKSHRGHYFADVITEGGYPNSIVTMALRSLPPDHESLSPSLLLKLAAESDTTLSRPAIRTLALSGKPDSLDLLLSVARSPDFHPQARADALVGLIGSEKHAAQVTQLVVGGLKGDEKVRPAGAMASLILRKGEEPRWNPPAPGAEAYLTFFKRFGKPDPDAGWRWFFSYAQCSKCHTLQGRGGTTGPDLTFIAKRMDRKRLVESIITPSREIAPRYVPWIVELKSGKTLTGIALNREGNNEVFASSDGKVTRIPTNQIEARHPSRVSVMPDGLASKIGPRVIYDIIGLLEATANEK